MSLRSRKIIASTGALPYSDGSGFEVDIQIEAREGRPDRLVLNENSEFCDFEVSKWPYVRAAIDRAVHARELLRSETPDDS